MELMLAFASFAAGGVLERHPRLRCAFLEGTCGWLPWWLWRLDEAWECVEACRAKHPRDDQVRYFRAFLLQRMKRPAEAETQLRDLIKSGPQYPYVKYASRHLLGVVLDQLGQYEEAMRWLTSNGAPFKSVL